MLATPNFHLPEAGEFRAFDTYYSPPSQKFPQEQEPRLGATTLLSIPPLKTVIVNTIKVISSRSPLRRPARDASPTLIRPSLSQRLERSSLRSRTARRLQMSNKQQMVHDLVKADDIEGLRKIAHTVSPEDVNTPDAQGNTPLYYASQTSLGMTAFLLHLGARVNCYCECGNTPLHAAFAADREEVILCLLRGGADLQRRNKAKADPIALASDRLRGTLGLGTEEHATSFTTRDVLQKLKPKRTAAKPAKRVEVRKSTAPESRTQILRTVTEGRIRVRDWKIRRHSPLYPSPMRSGLRFEGECLSRDLSSPTQQL